MSTDARIPMNSATLPIDTAVARSGLREIPCGDLGDAVEHKRLAGGDHELAGELDAERGWREDADDRAAAGEQRADRERSGNRVPSHRPTGSASTT